MSSQDTASIPFMISHEQQSFRLLELPPDLLGLINAEPSKSLFLKSAKSSNSNLANAVLCTDTETYQVRQVQSSNSVFVLQPSEPVSDLSNVEALPTTGLSGIARCTTMLELIPANASGTIFLKNNVGAFYGPGAERDSEGVSTEGFASKCNSRLEVFADAPLSLQEFNTAWTELCAFEANSKSYIPTPACLSSIWHSMNSAMTLKGLHLENDIYYKDIAGPVEEDGFPTPLLQAVINRLQSDKIIPMDGWANISQEKTIPWVGFITLASRSNKTEGLAIAEFLLQWQNNLPEAWRQHASLDLLKGTYSCPSPGRIISNEFRTEDESANPIQLSTSGRRLGKWHEKFKNARR